MAKIDQVDDHGLEVIRKAGFIPDDTYKTQYGIRTSATGTFKPTGLQTDFLITTLSVSDTAVALPTTALSNRNSMIIYNTSDTYTLYLGKSNVTADTVNGTTSGWKIFPEGYQAFDITDSIIIYGIMETGVTVTVQVLEIA